MSQEVIKTQFPSTYYNPLIPATLLNPKFASLITTVSTATRLSLRLASIITEAVFESLKYGTATSMDLSRRILISAISAAKILHSSRIYGENEIRDSISQAYYQSLENYTNLGIYLINNTFSLAELFIHTGFHLTSKTVKTGISAAEESVRIIDGLFGSTDTSRALAAIITLVKKEVYEDDDFHLAKLGNIVVLRAITKAMVAFACLQSVTHIRSAETVKLVLMYENIVTTDGQSLTNLRTYECSNHQCPRSSTSQSHGPQTDLSASDSYITQEMIVRNFPWKYESDVNTQISQKTANMDDQTTSQTSNLDSSNCDGTPNQILESDSKSSNDGFVIVSDVRDITEPDFNNGNSHTRLRTPSHKSSLFRFFQTISRRVIHHRRPTECRGPEDIKNVRCLTLAHPPPSSRATKNQSASRSCSDSENPRRTQQHTCSCGSPISDTNHNDEGFMVQHFPQRPLIRNVSRFIRYASASYGKNFMKILGIGVLDDMLHHNSQHHPNHYSFAKHTSLPLESILLSSFTNVSSLSSHRLHNLVHYVAVDHSICAIVLTCRGTLGLSDVLTDLTCDYAEMYTWGKTYLAHAGMLQSARILASSRSEVYQTIRQALIDHPSYGLILCGHSLGGGVAALLSILWSIKIPTQGNLFVTSEESGLPGGRSIHCFTYGVPCVVSLNLSKECSELITSVVNRYDIVPCLSLGLLKDFKNIAMSLYEESHIADLVISSVLGIRTERSAHTRHEQMNREGNPSSLGVTDEQQLSILDPLTSDPDRDWFWSLIKTMRADMVSEKLYPPGSLYLLETTPTLNVQPSQPGAPATRVTMHQCKNVEERFSEITFSKSMFLDHSPRSYEDTIALLTRGLNEFNADPVEQPRK